MRANVATELNYLWKVKMVGQPYMDPQTRALRESRTGEVLVFTTFTTDQRIKDMWRDGQLSL